MLTEDEKKKRDREKSKRYRERHPDRLKASKQKYLQKPETKLKLKIYAQNNREKINRRAAKYRNDPKRKAYEKQWYANNREHLLALGKAYHARPEIKLRERQKTLIRKYGSVALEVLTRDNNRCRKCSGTEKISIHHIDADKTNNTMDNMIVLCNSCHIKLHNFVPRNLRRLVFDEWMKTKNGEMKENG